MGFSDRLYINKVIMKEPENIEEWLQRFIGIILKENSNCKGKDRHYRKKEKAALANKKEKEKSNGTT